MANFYNGYGSSQPKQSMEENRSDARMKLRSHEAYHKQNSDNRFHNQYPEQKHSRSAEVKMHHQYGNNFHGQPNQSRDENVRTDKRKNESSYAPQYEHNPDYQDHQNPNGSLYLQEQTLKQHQRSTEASAQMVYGVYENLIAILEEVEQRELKNKHLQHQLPRSDVYLPNQSHKKDRDVSTILEAQLVLLESQLRTCRSEIRDKVKEHLLELTLQWNAARHNEQLPNDHRTDHYIGQLVEILSRGGTSHPEKFLQSPGDVEGVTQKDMELVMGAQHKTAELDRQFEDPSRKAKAPNIRSGDPRKGAERVMSTRSDLIHHLPQHLTEEKMDLQ